MSEAVRAGYKQTEVGVIPEDWEVKSLGNIAPLQRGFDLPESQLLDGDCPVVYSNGIMNFHKCAMVKGPGVVTGRSGTPGKVHYVDRDYWPHNTSLWVTSFCGNEPRFVYYLYAAIGFSRFTSGSGVPTLNRNDAHAYRTIIPSSSTEQRAIATALSDTDALLAKLDALIAKKCDLKVAAMQQLLTGQTRLPGLSGACEVKLLGDVSTFLKGKGLPKSSLTPSGAEPCIHYGELFTRYPETIGEIISRTNDSRDSFRSIENDVLMPTSDVTPRGLAKASCVRVDDVILGGDILVIRSDRKCVYGPFLS